MSQLSRNFGILTAYGLGAWLQYNQIPYVFISIPIVYLINFALLPNTPHYLVKKGRIDVSRIESWSCAYFKIHLQDAEKSLKYYKGCKGATLEEAVAISGELERLQLLARQRENTSKLSLRDICKCQEERCFAMTADILIDLCFSFRWTWCHERNFNWNRFNTFEPTDRLLYISHIRSDDFRENWHKYQSIYIDNYSRNSSNRWILTYHSIGRPAGPKDFAEYINSRFGVGTACPGCISISRQSWLWCGTVQLGACG